MHSGGSQYGAPPPEMTFAGGGGIISSGHLRQTMAEEASPISSRPPAVGSSMLAPARSEGFTDEENLAAAVGEEADRGGIAGNRWPRQETLALLKIRSDLDAAFRDATLKGPLWEEVSRQLAEMGYQRSAKKCKEKFENVHKYYKRTKDGRAGRQDGKAYRFFTQLEALHSPAATGATSSAVSAYPAANTALNHSHSATLLDPSSRFPPSPLNSNLLPPIGGAWGGFSFSPDAFSSSASESEEDTEENLSGEQNKRKRASSGRRGHKMMAFFEGLMKQVIERQEAMQQRFLETIERREQERMAREEDWKRQEMARVQREREIIAQERALSASRDASIVAFLQKMTGQVAPPMAAPPPSSAQSQQQRRPSPSSVSPPPRQPQSQYIPHQAADVIISPQDSAAPDVEGSAGVNCTDPASSRWPKAEVHALITLRIGLESRYQEAGPKGPLWEEIAAGMKGMGYSRTPKRCKEKWENINKYFKKVKESNKKRPEDSKTCPYFHQLDALYRRKLGQTRDELECSSTPADPLQPAAVEEEETKDGGGGGGGGGDPDGDRAAVSNGRLSPAFFHHEQNYDSGSLKKPGDIVRELMDRQQQLQHQQRRDMAMETYDKLQDPEGDSMDRDVDHDDDPDSEIRYVAQYQERPGVNGASDCGASSSFMAMVQ